MQTQQFDNADQFLTVMEARDKSMRREPIRNMRLHQLDGDRSLVVNRSVLAKDKAFASLCGLLGVPAPFLRTTELDLAETILTRLAPKTQDKQIVIKNDELVGTASVDAPHYSALKVTEKVVKELRAVSSIRYVDLGTHFDVCFVSHELETKPRKDDIVRGGLRLLYSEDFSIKPQIGAYAERLICTNGMTHREFDHNIEFKSVEQFLADIVSSVARTTTYFNEKVSDQLRKSTELKVDGAQAIRRSFRRERLNSRYLDPVLAAHVIENDGTAYGVIQAFTRAANELNYRERINLQYIGGQELQVASRAHCPTCYGDL